LNLAADFFMKWRKPNRTTSTTGAMPLCQTYSISNIRCTNWPVFEQALGMYYANEIGRPGLPIRLLVGLHYLKPG
jgi:hypothetical protein